MFCNHHLLFLCEILVYMYEWPGVYTIRAQINFHRSQEYFFQVMPFFLALGH